MQSGAPRGRCRCGAGGRACSGCARGSRRCAPTALGPGTAEVAALRVGDGALVVIALTDSGAALEAASTAVRSTPLLPGRWTVVSSDVRRSGTCCTGPSSACFPCHRPPGRRRVRRRQGAVAELDLAAVDGGHAQRTAICAAPLRRGHLWPCALLGRSGDPGTSTGQTTPFIASSPVVRTPDAPDGRTASRGRASHHYPRPARSRHAGPPAAGRSFTVRREAAADRRRPGPLTARHRRGRGLSPDPPSDLR